MSVSRRNKSRVRDENGRMVEASWVEKLDKIEADIRKEKKIGKYKEGWFGGVCDRCGKLFRSESRQMICGGCASGALQAMLVLRA